MCAANRTSSRTELALATNPFDAKSEVIGRSALDTETILSGQYWGELRTFLAVAKAKSLTKAAESLSISHMTVGREIRRLQDMMGSQLAIISKSGVTLTPRGLELATTLIKLDHTLFSLTNELRAESREAKVLCVSALPMGWASCLSFRLCVSFHWNFRLYRCS